MSPATVMTAVPHWSSWKTGMSSSSSSTRSISKHAGAAMSSRLMPPYIGAMARQTSMTRRGSVLPVSAPPWRQWPTGTGQASTPAKALKSAALPSITGMEAAAPRSPSPRMAVPSETTATRLRFALRSNAARGSAAMAFTACATPGVYARHRSFCVAKGRRSATPTLPPSWNANTSSLEISMAICPVLSENPA